MKRSLLSFALLSAVLVLTGCNGTISSVSFPAGSPWETMATGILSPTDDLVAVSAGAGLESALVPGNPAGFEALVACQASNGPYILPCSDRTCDPQTVCDSDQVIEKRYAYTLEAFLDREVFTAGSIQIQDGSGATQMGLAINAGNTGGSFDVAAGFSEGLIPGVQFSEVDEVGALVLAPHWDGFDQGEITGQICSEGVCTTQVIAGCDTDGPNDGLAYVASAQPGSYSGTCGTIPVNLTINPAYASVGACITARKATCNGLTGQDRKTCNHAQIGVCHATFNVPSAHN
ncbi:MAG TPA: hypothetical protein VLT87_25265 [Thermoanaerobaculia bacterium]|nr:hypothetical protein [Thermoanaerobaculia bacterium]